MKRLIVVLALLFVTPKHLEARVPYLPSIKEFDCLVTNIYHEARGESLEGKIAVGLVTLNRVKHTKYPNTICAVVYQKKQFSWTNKLKNLKINAKEWYACVQAANLAIKSTSKFTATHYHADYVNPRWKLQKVSKIGKHIFYVLASSKSK